MQYALVDANGIIQNVIEYDGISAYTPPIGLSVQQANDWLIIGNNITDPIPVAAPVTQSPPLTLNDIQNQLAGVQAQITSISTQVTTLAKQSQASLNLTPA